MNLTKPLIISLIFTFTSTLAFAVTSNTSPKLQTDKDYCYLLKLKTIKGKIVHTCVNSKDLYKLKDIKKGDKMQSMTPQEEMDNASGRP